MKNRDIGLESALVGDAIRRLPKDKVWFSIHLWFEGVILEGNATSSNGEKITYDAVMEQWFS
jgi:hypothetical protein